MTRRTAAIASVAVFVFVAGAQSQLEVDAVKLTVNVKTRTAQQKVAEPLDGNGGRLYYPNDGEIRSYINDGGRLYYPFDEGKLVTDTTGGMSAQQRVERVQQRVERMCPKYPRAFTALFVFLVLCGALLVVVLIILLLLHVLAPFAIKSRG